MLCMCVGRTKTQDYNKTVYTGGGSQQSKGQNISNPPPSGTGSDISSSMYGNKSHAALNKVNVSRKLSLIVWCPSPGRSLIFLLCFAFAHSSRTRNNRSTREHRHHSIWQEPKQQVLHRKPTANNYTFKPCRLHYTTWACISKSIR